ncbi:hypothetical protein [Egbenema bharatensis]|uniref:hypothetical protein n=1 Tax=Egbenema bharatensis TaxID=3463334 RepID=UPI003A84BF45
MDRSQPEGIRQNPSQQKARHAAAQAFMEALDQLGQQLQPSEDGQSSFPPSVQTSPSQTSPVQANPSAAVSPTAQPPGHSPAPDPPSAIDPQDWEEAAADIEAFMQTRP